MYSVKKKKEKLNMSEEHVRRLIRNGEIKGELNSKKEGYIIREKDLINFMNIKPKYRDKVAYEKPAEELTNKELWIRQIRFHMQSINELLTLIENESV